MDITGAEITKFNIKYGQRACIRCRAYLKPILIEVTGYRRTGGLFCTLSFQEKEESYSSKNNNFPEPENISVMTELFIVDKTEISISTSVKGSLSGKEYDEDEPYDKEYSFSCTPLLLIPSNKIEAFEDDDEPSLIVGLTRNYYPIEFVCPSKVDFYHKNRE